MVIAIVEHEGDDEVRVSQITTKLKFFTIIDIDYQVAIHSYIKINFKKEIELIQSIIRLIPPESRNL